MKPRAEVRKDVRKQDIIAGYPLALWAALATMGGVSAGCGEGETDDITKVQGEIASLPASSGGATIDYASTIYWSKPDVAAVQYAAPSLDNCSGVMIGPNTLYTAAHCGFAPHPITFRTYRRGSSATSDTESFNCRHLVQTFGDTDSIVLFCDPNASGISPGDKYGYVDFDISDPTVGQSIYSISTNFDGSGSVPVNARLYATGQVTSMTNNDWYVPDAAPNTGTTMNMWGEGGMSGSPHLNPANHRMIIAPLSVAGGWSRGALSMHNLLYWGFVATGNVNSTEVTARGLNPATYSNQYIDIDLDWLFDVQKDLERVRGENARGWYFLGFDSPRRNALWDQSGGVTVDATNRWANIVSTGGYSDRIWNPRLNLAAGTYRLTFMSLTNSTDTASALWAGFKNGANYYGSFVPTTVGAGWVMSTQTITVPAGSMVMLGQTGNANVNVTALSVIKQGDVMNFDTYDKRFNWRNDIDGSRAMIVPDGRVTGTPNWAARLAGTPTAGYPLRNRQLAMDAGHRYQVCYDAYRTSAGGTAQVEMRVLSAGVQAGIGTANLTASWATYCLPLFTPGTDDNNLQIRLASGNSEAFIDNITINEM